MHRLCERGENCRSTQLVVCEVFEHVCIKTKNGQLVQCGDAGQELHDEDLVVEREASVIFLQEVVKLLAKGLRVVQ